MKFYCFLFVFIVSSNKMAKASGKLSIKFVKFYNPGSRLQNGGCCDNIGICISSCEIFMKFCLTLRSSSSICSLINFETPVLGGDSFDFSNSLTNGISNPVIYSFDQWTESFKATIRILDDDGSNPLGIGRKADLVSTHDVAIAENPDVDDDKATRHDQILRGYRSELTIEYRIFCDQGYFRPSCKERCVPTDNSTGHFTCDYGNSRRVCLPYWHGRDCTRLCKPRNDDTGHYGCSSEGEKNCLANWYGSNCTRYCAAKDDGTGHYICDVNGDKVCHKNWYGENCLKYCVATRNYSCSENGEMVCTDRFYGVNCTKYCRASEIGNFRCVDDKTVKCKENYYGINCTVYCVAKRDAFSNYSCSEDGMKICDANWYGIDCDIHCENTSTSFCSSNGTKTCHMHWYGANCDKYCKSDNSTSLRYKCDANGKLGCLPGWYGTNCEVFTGCTNDTRIPRRYFCHQLSGMKICNLGWTGKDCSFTMKTSFVTNLPSISSKITESPSAKDSWHFQKNWLISPSPSAEIYHASSAKVSPFITDSYFPSSIRPSASLGTFSNDRFPSHETQLSIFTTKLSASKATASLAKLLNSETVQRFRSEAPFVQRNSIVTKSLEFQSESKRVPIKSSIMTTELYENRREKAATSSHQVSSTISENEDVIATPVRRKVTTSLRQEGQFTTSKLHHTTKRLEETSINFDSSAIRPWLSSAIRESVAGIHMTKSCSDGEESMGRQNEETIASVAAKGSITKMRPKDEDAKIGKSSKLRIWLYVGIPVMVTALLITLAAFILHRNNLRVSMSKVKPLKIKSEFSEPEKVAVQ